MILPPWEAGKFAEKDKNTRRGQEADDDDGAKSGPHFLFGFCLWLVSTL